MKKILQRLLLRIRRFYWYHCKVHKSLPCINDADKASEIIYNTLMSPNPCMIARFGDNELRCMLNYLSISKHKNQFINLISCKTHAWWWTDQVRHSMQSNAGFFPNTDEMLTCFGKLLYDCTKDIDILGSWIEDETMIAEELEHTQRVFLPYLEPYFHKPSWARALEGKNVLVVHPFAEEILSQYKNRDLLFQDKSILPDCNISVIKAVQSIGGNTEQGFKNWFEALDWMKDRIDKHNYDICIIGCGAYGMPLAAHVKKMGKKAIHLGGATQMMFGITGKRWETWPENAYQRWGLPTHFYQKLINEHWIRPNNSNKPRNAQQVENGCYW